MNGNWWCNVGLWMICILGDFLGEGDGGGNELFKY